MSDPEEFNALRLIREGARATGDDEAIPNLVGGLHYWHSVASKARRENTELRATIDRLRDVRRSAVAEGHASPYLAHMVDQATKAHPDPRRVETAEELEALSDGAVYLSDGHGMAEQKQGGVWYAVGSHQPFEPDLPGVVLWTPEGEQ